jgi:hypothetical protein
MNVREEPGWTGGFTREQADGAIPNGTRVRKCRLESGDAHPVGSLGVVLGSMATPLDLLPAFPDDHFAYFVEWDDHPRMAVGIIASKIEALA